MLNNTQVGVTSTLREGLHWGSKELSRQEIRVGYGQIIINSASMDAVVVSWSEIDDLILKLAIAREDLRKLRKERSSK